MRVVSVRILLLGILLIIHPTGLKTVALGQSPSGTTELSTLGQEPVRDPLLRLLVSKGVLTTKEAAVVLSSGTVAQQHDRLATLLKEKGLISNAEFDALTTSDTTPLDSKAAARPAPSAGDPKSIAPPS